MLLRLDRVGRTFVPSPGRAVEALRDVSLELEAGDFVALLGPSGCGKSTLLRLIAGLDAPDTGTLTWPGGRPAPGRTGFVFQDANLLAWLSAEANAALPLVLGGAGAAPARAAARAALARVGLAGFERARPASLSGGMRMRVSIARALVTRPSLLLMDEPFAALDEFTRHALQAELRALWREAGCTVVFVTHSIAEAAYLARRVVLMAPRPGRVAGVLRGLDDAPGDDRRLDPAYHALIAEIARAMRAAAA